MRTCDAREKGASEGGGSACMAHPTMLGGRRMLTDLLGRGECLVEKKTRFSGNCSLPAAILSARRLAYDRQASRREVRRVATDLVTIPCSRAECRWNCTKWAPSGRVGWHTAGGFRADPSEPARRAKGQPDQHAARASSARKLSDDESSSVCCPQDTAGYCRSCRQALMKGLKGLANFWDRGGGDGRSHAC